MVDAVMCPIYLDCYINQYSYHAMPMFVVEWICVTVRLKCPCCYSVTSLQLAELKQHVQLLGDIVMHCGTDVVASLQHTPLRSAQQATVENSSTSCTRTSSKQQYTTTCKRSNKYIHAMLLYQTNTWSFFPSL